MKTAFAAALSAVSIVSFSATAEEGNAAVYVLDRSPEFAATEGACLPYHRAEPPGPKREILAIAKAPAGATLFVFAVHRDAPHLGLAPLVAPGGETSPAARFPATGSTWAYDQVAGPVDLYIAIFDNRDPLLGKIVEYSEWLVESLSEKDEEESLLHTEAILKRLGDILRQRRVEDYRVRFDDPLIATRFPPSAKAVTTRSTTEASKDSVGGFPKSPIAAVRRGLKTLDAEWQQDSHKIAYGPGQPGIRIFTLTAPAKAAPLP